MAVEVLSYRLSLRGKPVGSHVLRTEERGRRVALEAKMMLQGSLGQHTIMQSSQAQRHPGLSLAFREEVLEGPERRRYEVRFDQESGLVKATRGANDSAEVPYLRPYGDPLELLYRLRRLGEPGELVHVPMLGKDVVVEYLGVAGLETVMGERLARVYVLNPGGSYVYVDREAPHVILKLTQRMGSQHLDALLTKIAEEDAMPESGTPAGKGKGRRRRRRKRRNRST
ncbi:MAG TPA: hypothetical protein VF171_07345 [Trueperaceae bacterium]